MDNEYDFHCASNAKKGFQTRKWTDFALTNLQQSESKSNQTTNINTRSKRKGDQNSFMEEDLEDVFKDSFNYNSHISDDKNIDYFKRACIDNGLINLDSLKSPKSNLELESNKSANASIIDSCFQKGSKKFDVFGKSTPSPSLFSSDSGESYKRSHLSQIKNKILSPQNYEYANSSAKDKKIDKENSQMCRTTPAAKQLNDVTLLHEKENVIIGDSVNPAKTQAFKPPPSICRKRFNSEELKCNSKTKSNAETMKSTLQNENLWESTQYSKQISQLFENLEQSVCQMDRPTVNDIVNCSEESCFADSINKLTQEATSQSSIGDLVKKNLLQNATKSVLPSNLVNRTVISTSETFKELGSFYGLPNKVQELIKLYKGIDKLYDWQDECLKLPAIKQRRNLIYSLPTSGGKTLVAEILILRELICRKHNVIFVLPYVAIVQEKIWALSPFAVDLNFLIEEYAAGKGACPPRKRRYKNSVFIATTEKALNLINSLVENGRIDEIGLLVVDELHLIGEDKRGPKLETLLTKLMYLKEDIQIVGMSATIGNLPDLCKFLNADVYTRNFRPVELTEYVKCGNKIVKVNYGGDEENIFEFVKTVNFQYSDTQTKLDPDHLSGLVSEVIPGGSCLIFCPSKKNCENVTRLLCALLSHKLKTYKQEEKLLLLNALQTEAETLCDILKISVPFGIAYHHSGLTAEERKLIEESFRAGILSVICCTSTLAAGVNLPAKRVIIRKPYIGQEFISLSRYKQMVGRAGRTGFGELGESILICTPNELPKIKELFILPMDQTISKMNKKDGEHLRELFLSCISLQTANTKSQLEHVTNKTLLAVQQEKLDVNLKLLSKKVLSDLFTLGGITILNDTLNVENEEELLNISMKSNITDSNCSKQSTRKRIILNNDTKLTVSKLGSASIKGGLEISSALILYEDLLQAQESLVLIDCLHLLYLITPYNLSDQIKPSKTQYHSIMSRIGGKERKTATMLGITEACIIRLLSNQIIKTVSERVLDRFYISLMLYDLWKEVPIVEVSEKFQVSRGIVQHMMTSASTFAANVVSFCDELEEFWSFAHLLKGMCQRLAHCCTKELLPLMELPAVKLSRAKQLYNAGYKTLQSIAKANEGDLINSIEFMSRTLATQLIAAAKLLLVQKIETLREQAEDMLRGTEDSLFL